ncbi:MAG: TonB-dependent receptor [Sphingomonas bacterium]|nr:TonB-dependent receptor [Sphingomonas bacterium]
MAKARTGLVRLLAGTTAMTMVALPAYAQDAAATQEPAQDQARSGSSEPDEIVVTANRQGAVAISRVPMSITAQSQESLDERGIKTAQDISRIVPALRIEDTGATASNISIRGVRSQTGSATTGVYLDDTALQARALGGSANGGGVFLPPLFDLERVEVLKGPQGTLYGGSSQGGTVRFITPAPSLTKTSIYARAEVNKLDQGEFGYEGGVALGLPIIEDKLGIRVSGWGRHIGGWVNYVDRRDTSRITAKDVNYQNQTAFKAAATWAPTPDLRITPSFYYASDRKNAFDQIYRDFDGYTTPAFGTFQDGANRGRPIFGSYTGAPLTTGVNAGQNITGGLLPAGYVPPTTGGVVTNIPGLIGQRVFIHPAHTYGPFNLGKYDNIENDNVGDSFTGDINPERSFRKSKIYLPSLTIDWDIGPVALKSITSYLRDSGSGTLGSSFISSTSVTSTAGYSPAVQSAFLFDTPVAIRSLFDYSAKREAKQQEIRLAYAPDDNGISWVAGVFYSDAKTHSLNENFANRSLPREVAFNIPQTFFPVHTAADIATMNQQGQDQTLEETSIAIFGEANYQVTDRLKATVGVRMAREEISYDQRTYGLLVNAPFATGQLISGNVVEKPITPKFSVSYQATPDDLYYVTAAKGYRVGGVQGQANAVTCAADLAALNISNTPSDYGSDTVWNYEAGAKIRMFDRRLQLSGSAFYIEWDKPQTPYRLPTCNFQYTTNIGKAVSKGFDLQGTLRVSDGFSLDFALGYTDAKYTQDVLTEPNAAGVRTVLVNNGDDIVEVPKWSGNIGGRYQVPVANGWNAYAFGNYQYTGGYKITLGPGVLSHSPDAYRAPWIDNVTARLGLSNDRYDLSLFADNLFNQNKLRRTALVGRTSCRNVECSVFGANYQAIRGTTLRPRTIGITATARY